MADRPWARRRPSCNRTQTPGESVGPVARAHPAYLRCCLRRRRHLGGPCRAVVVVFVLSHNTVIGVADSASWASQVQVDATP